MRRSKQAGIYLRRDVVARDLASVTIRGERSKGHRGRTVPLTAFARVTMAAVLGDRAMPIYADLREHMQRVMEREREDDLAFEDGE